MTTTTIPTSTTGPDTSHCGEPIDWADRVGLSEQLRAAASSAMEWPEFDIELCRWSVDDILAGQYTQWWTNQRSLLRRHLRVTITDESINFVVHRRTDLGDGFVKCYVRIEGGETS